MKNYTHNDIIQAFAKVVRYDLLSKGVQMLSIIRYNTAVQIGLAAKNRIRYPTVAHYFCNE